MTFTEKQEHINGFYIELRTEKPDFNVYHVAIYREYSDGTCGFPMKENHTPIRRNALATYNRYKKTAKQLGEIYGAYKRKEC